VTAARRSYLEMLARDDNETFDENLTKPDALKLTDELRQPVAAAGWSGVTCYSDRTDAWRRRKRLLATTLRNRSTTIRSRPGGASMKSGTGGSC
jgi:hypothetical protein